MKWTHRCQSAPKIDRGSASNFGSDAVWCTGRRELSFHSDQSGLQEVEMASAVHLTLHQLEFRNLAFRLTVRPRQRDRRTNSRLILGNAIDERGHEAVARSGYP